MHTRKGSKDLEVPTETPLLMLVLDRFQKKLQIVIRFLQMDCGSNRNAGVFIPIVQEHCLHIFLGRVYEKTPILGNVWEAKKSEQARDMFAVAQFVFHMKQSPCFVPEIGYPYKQP